MPREMNHSAENTLSRQRTIAALLGVRPQIDVVREVERRTDFLCKAVTANARASLVLGISGGVDSLTAGLLCQRAAERVRKAGHACRFIAVRLPYGEQRDESDAQRSVQTIRPDVMLTVDVKPASDAMLASVKAAQITFVDVHHEDFILGNIKARQRMIAQYAIAGNASGLVVGTDHAAEALMGFFTKYGDGGCDITPLSGLNKRQVRALAQYLGADEALVNKVPTADLESLVPLKPDESAFGITYTEIDDFLEGKPVSEQVSDVILRQYDMTAHKRAQPPGPD